MILPHPCPLPRGEGESSSDGLIRRMIMRISRSKCIQRQRRNPYQPGAAPQEQKGGKKLRAEGPRHRDMIQSTYGSISVDRPRRWRLFLCSYNLGRCPRLVWIGPLAHRDGLIRRGMMAVQGSNVFSKGKLVWAERQLCPTIIDFTAVPENDIRRRQPRT